MRRLTTLRTPLTALIVLIACGACRPKDEEPLTREEAQAALVATQLSNDAHALTYDVVEVTTGFTLGQAANAAAENMRDFVRSQIPCATAELTDEKVLGIDFSARGDSCTWRGKAYTGRVEVQIDKLADGEISITHSWLDLSDGVITVNGGASVEWNFNVLSRHVAHSLTWESEKGAGEATGDRTQTLLEGGGFQVDGTRTWTGGEDKTWALEIEGVQLRAQDPVPQAGTYRLVAPNGKQLTLGFERVDATTIAVTIGNGDKDFTFNVKGRE